jgi:exodeoxyribonuclease VII small subunit
MEERVGADDARENVAGEPTFEEALARLELIVRDLEEGNVGLADGLKRYEEGVALLRRCYQLLEGAQRRIELLNRVGPDGQEECEPFEDDSTTLAQKAAARARRRSRPAASDASPGEDEIDGPGRLF